MERIWNESKEEKPLKPSPTGLIQSLGNRLILNLAFRGPW